jgi:hypothetical protein
MLTHLRQHIAAPREQIVLPYWSDPQRLAHTHVAVSPGAIAWPVDDF